MRNSRGFASLTPTRALPWTRWGLTALPGPQLELAMTVGHCISCLRLDSSTPPTISHWAAQFCCTLPNRRTSHHKTAEKSSSGGCVTQRVLVSGFLTTRRPETYFIIGRQQQGNERSPEGPVNDAIIYVSSATSHLSPRTESWIYSRECLRRGRRSHCERK